MTVKPRSWLKAIRHVGGPDGFWHIDLLLAGAAIAF
jgi:hypothetical protein